MLADVRAGHLALPGYHLQSGQAAGIGYGPGDLLELIVFH